MQFKHIIPLASIVLLMACNPNDKKETKDSKPTMGVMNMMETVSIAKSNPLVQLKLAGELKPYEETSLFAKVNSYVKQIRVDIGDKVTKGQVLVVLEAPEIVSQIANAKAKVQAQEAVYLSTKATYDRMLQADETKGAVAKDAMDQIKARKLADEAQLNAARSAYNEIRNINDYLVI